MATGPSRGLGVGGVGTFEGFNLRELERALCNGVSVWDIQAGGTRYAEWLRRRDAVRREERRVGSRGLGVRGGGGGAVG